MQQGTQCTYNVTLWCLRLTILQVETQQGILSVVVELYVTVNCIKILSVAQQCFYGEFVTGNNANYT
jgi:hypothetical protein